MSLDEQLPQCLVPLPRPLDTAGTAGTVLARATGKAPEGVADVTVRPDGPRREEAGGTTVRREPDARPPAVCGPAPVAHLDPAPETLGTDDRTTGPVRRTTRNERLGPLTPDSTSSPRKPQSTGRPGLPALPCRAERPAALP